MKKTPATEKEDLHRTIFRRQSGLLCCTICVCPDCEAQYREAMEMVGKHIGLNVRNAPSSVVHDFGATLAYLYEIEELNPTHVLSEFLVANCGPATSH